MSIPSSNNERMRYIFDRARNAPVYDLARRTPLEVASHLSERVGTRLWLKREDLQPTFSFKLRGAYHFIRNMNERERKRGVIAASAGNHAQGVALSARELEVNATIFMPRTTPEIKVEAVAALGANIELVGDDYDEACAHALAEADGTGAVFIHPFDNPDVIAGQGTLGIEIIEQLESQMDGPPEIIFLPVGGGGLAAGVAATVKSMHPGVKVIGVEPEDAASMKAAIEAGHPVDIGATGIFADGVAVRQVGELTFEMCRDLLDDIVTVSVDQVCSAVKSIFEEVRAVAEPAGALAVAGALQYSADNPGTHGDWVALVSGANVNFDRLGHVVERCALGDGSEALLSVTIPERAGSFLEFCRTLGSSPVTEFNYRHNGTDNARVFVGVRLKDPVSVLQQRMEKLGYEFVDLTGNEVAKLHLRHLVGGRLPVDERERLFRFEFPERPGALLEFLEVLAGRWSISLFHYRNHGSAHGRVLAGFLVPEEDDEAFHHFLEDTHYLSTDETENIIYQEFLSNHDELKQADRQKLRAL